MAYHLWYLLKRSAGEEPGSVEWRVSVKKGTVKSRKRSNVGPVVVLVAGALALFGFLGWGIYRSEQTAKLEKQNESMKKDDETCYPSPVKVQIEGLEYVRCKAAGHVAEGVKVTYETDPPLSGNHAETWLPAKFFDAPQSPEKLVHNLEHGNVVIYYDKAKLPAADLEKLKQLTAKYSGPWDGVVAVPRTDADHPLILTAWENALRLTAYDQAKVEKFVDAFRGRGPENPVR